MTGSGADRTPPYESTALYPLTCTGKRGSTSNPQTYYLWKIFNGRACSSSFKRETGALSSVCSSFQQWISSAREHVGALGRPGTQRWRAAHLRRDHLCCMGTCKHTRTKCPPPNGASKTRAAIPAGGDRSIRARTAGVVPLPR